MELGSALAAGQLLAQGREGLVGSQRAGGTGTRGRARGDRAGRTALTRPARATATGGARGAVGRAGVAGLAAPGHLFLVGLGAGLLHLLAVRLEPGARLGVLVLPLLA